MRRFLLLAAAPVLAFAVGARAEGGAPPTRVVVGVYVDRVTEMSLRENHFHADFYVWFRWQDGDEKFDPLKTFDVADGSITQRQTEVREEHAATKEHPAFHYASVRCEAEVTQAFDVARFPLDDHVLRIEIEDTENDVEKLEYVADVENSGIGPDVQVAGWRIDKPSSSVALHRYASNFGDLDSKAGANGSDYSQFAFSVPLVRVGAAYFLKLFFGLFIAVCIALLAFHVKPTDLDARFGLPVGSIFAAVGSLYVTSQILPDTNILTLSDRLHIFAFVVIFLSLVESTRSIHLWNSGGEEAARRLDRNAFWALGAFYFVGSAVVVMSA